MFGVTSEDSVQLLGKVFSGEVLAPGDRGYDDARRVHNGLIDRHPAVIARCLHTADVADAVDFGRSEGLEIRFGPAVTMSRARRSATAG